MINNYYSKETYEELIKRNKKFLILSISICVFGLAFFFLSAFLINVKTVLIIKIIDILILSSSLIISSYLLLEKFIPGVSRKKFLYRLLTVDRFEGKLKIVEIRKPYLVKKGIYAYEIEAVDEENKTLICYYEALNELELKKDDVVDVTIAMNFIVGIKETSHEE